MSGILFRPSPPPVEHVFVQGLHNRRMFGQGEVVINSQRPTGQIVFSPPLSRSPTPDIPQSVGETEPRTIGRKTAEFFGFPLSSSAHSSSPDDVRDSAEADTNAQTPSERAPSPVRTHSLTYTLVFEQNRPSTPKSPQKYPKKLPSIDRFLPPRRHRPLGMEIRDTDGGNSTLPTFTVAEVAPAIEDGEETARQNCPTPPPLKIDPEFNVGSPESFLRYLVLDGLPSMASSPIPSSPVHDSPSPITPSPLGSPMPMSTAKEESNENIESLDLTSGPVSFAEGVIIGTEVPFRLIRLLGLGAFSSVWLARDIHQKLGIVGGRPKLPFKKDQVGAYRKSDRTIHGLRPPVSTCAKGNQISRSTSVYFRARNMVDGDKPYTQDDHDHGRLVALKMMDRTLCDNDNRTRISFMREVEILRHISHPSIVPYLHSFSTSTHHCVVLEAVLGGELFELLCQDDNFSRMNEPLIRRIFGELCHAVGWMHGVGLVHRDVKLENILCTINPFLPGADLPPPSIPLIKLSDFGLARFIDPVDPLLTTRCGSDSYAAPEIVLCRAYDGRQTDAWACGVVLFALATGFPPFDKPTGMDTRRALLSRIARVDYSWPEDAPLATEGLRSVVHGLLIRDPSKRLTIPDIWDNLWMHGEGAPPPPAPGGALVSGEISSVAREETV